MTKIYLNEADGKLSVRVGKLVPMGGKPFYILTVAHVSNNVVRGREFLTDSAGRMLRFATEKQAKKYAFDHGMVAYGLGVLVMGGFE